MTNETAKAVGAADQHNLNETLIMLLLYELFEADHEYGCGFCDSDNWRDAYAKLQKLAGYNKTTCVLGRGKDMSSLPDA